MSTIKTNAILDASGGNTTTINGVTPNAYNTMGKNRIINGAMEIDQRNAGASVTPANGAYTLDRWKVGLAQSSKYSVDQDTTVPAGFKNSLKVTSLSAYTPTSNDHFFIEQEIEGYNVIDLALGSSDAKTFTLSFWVRSSLTGTFAGSVINSARNRSYVFNYTISSADTWEQKSITIAGDTTGTWLTTNGSGLDVRFSLGAAGTWLQTAGSWSTGNVVASSGSVNLVATNAATLYITGVQLEVGSVSTEFERRPYGTELQLCQRYYDKSYNANTALGTVNFQGFRAEQGWNTTSAQKAVGTNFVIEKRTSPTIYIWDLGGNASKVSTISTSGGWTSNVGYTAVVDTNAKYFKVLINSSTAYGFGYHWAADAEL